MDEISIDKTGTFSEAIGFVVMQNAYLENEVTLFQKNVESFIELENSKKWRLKPKLENITKKIKQSFNDVTYAGKDLDKESVLDLLIKIIKVVDERNDISHAAFKKDAKGIIFKCDLSTKTETEISKEEIFDIAYRITELKAKLASLRIKKMILYGFITIELENFKMAFP